MQYYSNKEYEVSFRWEIEDFTLSPLKRGEKLCSPSFTVSTLGATKWYLVLIPEGTIDPAYMSLYLCRENGGSKIKRVTANFKLELCTDGNLLRSKSQTCKDISFGEKDSWGYEKFLRRKELDTMLEQSCVRSIIIRCGICASNIKSKWTENAGLQNLSDNFLSVYESGQFSDVVLHCEDTDVMAHRCILAARLPKLSLQLGLLNSETLVARCDIVNISLPALKCILFYAYSGKMNLPPSEIPPDLLVVAIRYELWDLIQKMKTYPSFYLATTIFNVEHESVSWRIDKSSLLKNNNFSLVRIVPSVSLYIDSIVITCYLNMDPKTNLVEAGGINIFLSGFEKKCSVSLSWWISVNSQESTLLNLYVGNHLFTDHNQWYIPLDIRGVPVEHCLDLICELDFCDGISSSTIREGWTSSKTPVSHFNDFSTLSNNLSGLLFTSNCYDFVIVCENQTFPVHAIVLAARSPVFNRMLQYDMIERRCRRVIIEDARSTIVQLMLSYMYSGIVRDLKYGEAFDLYRAADKYDMSVLKERCSWFLMSSMNVRNVRCLLALAYFHSDTVMIKHAFKFLEKTYLHVDLGSF
ncbi:speckle-type POZ protein B [Trichonephila inaurata madagascariensis]|uniref:Speckle-type POZ protein B n=1 Tax=Trichonephila inaurata madagascariensis TaxID=2747483 RepID=A0A8X6WSK0_9ARAC|nr:speckle-type POZ protein B [Trichonephila inaurata madagascariensis]